MGLSLYELSSGNPWFYFFPLFLGLVGLWSLVVRSLAKENAPSGIDSYGVFFAVGFVTLLWARWPSFLPLEFNPDESQVVVGARLLEHNPTPFIGADGTTQGPLLYYLSLAPSLPMEGSLDYPLLRLEGLGAVCLTYLFLFLSLRPRAGDFVAKVVTAILFTIEALATNSGLVSYSTEQVPMVFIFAMVWLFSCGDPADSRRAYLGGLAAGAIPYLKLQFVPVAAFILLFWGAWTWKRGRWRSLGFAALGLLTVPLLFTGWILASGAWNDFWQRYIVANLAHAEHPRIYRGTDLIFPETYPLMDRIAYSADILLLKEVELRSFFWAAGFSMLALGGLLIRDKIAARAVSAALGLLLSCLYIVVLPGHAYDHYSRALLAPCMLLIGLMLGRLPARRQKVLCGFLIALMLVPWLGERAALSKSHPFALVPEVLIKQSTEWPKPLIHSGVKKLRPFVDSGQRIAVWGWLPRLYVGTQTLPATRDIICERMLEPRYDLSYFRRDYLRELKQSQPPVIVDATRAFLYKDRALFGLDSFPELKEYVEKNYKEVFRDEKLTIYERVAPLS